jgi:integrase
MGDIVRMVRGGRFIGWYIRYKDVDGRRKQRASHQPSRLLAARMLVEIEARVARGKVGIDEPERDGVTVAELCERFLREFVSPRIKNLTAYRSDARTGLRRILPQLGQIPLSRLTRIDIEKARDAVAGQYRPNTVRCTLRPLGTALSWAVREGLCPTNPARGIELPRRETAIEYLGKEDADRLLAEAERRARKSDSPRWWSRWVAVTLALHTGMRRGEIFGLRWSDIDLDTQRLTVARSYRAAPKSGQARHLRLPSTLIPILREWRIRCPKSAKDWICPVLYQERWGISGERTAHGLPALLQAAGCKPLTRGWHALRHTFASHFIMQGGNILTLQKILGHADIGMTLVYSHLAPDFMAMEMDRVRFR